MHERLFDIWGKLRSNTPLVPCMTNMVTMEWVANSLLAVGASPVMGVEPSDMAALIAPANVLYINTGTADAVFAKYALQTARTASDNGKTVVMDPPGAGATPWRTGLAQTLLPHVHVLRANAGEALALTGMQGQMHGVDVVCTPPDVESLARTLAESGKRIVAISGREDCISDGHQTFRIALGTSRMTRITGMGCVLGAMVAAFCAVCDSRLEAAVLATACLCLCGEQAARQASGTGSFRIALLDALSDPDVDFFQKRLAKGGIHAG